MCDKSMKKVILSADGDSILYLVPDVVAILKPFNNCRVYDPCCGFLIIMVIVTNSLRESRDPDTLPMFETKRYNSLE